MTFSANSVLLDKLPQPFLDYSRLNSVVDQVTLFGGLNEEQLNKVVKKLKYLPLSHDEFVFQRGEKACYIYIVLSGRVKLKFVSPTHPMTGHEYTLGQCFGITSVIGIQNHSVTTQAEGNVELLVLSREDLMVIFDEDQALFSYLILNIARESCRRLNYLNDCFEENALETTQAGSTVVNV